MFLEPNQQKDVKKLDKLYMVLVPQGLNRNFDHVQDQILTGQQIYSMESLTRLLHVPTLEKGGDTFEYTESSIIISTHGKVMVIEKNVAVKAIILSFLPHRIQFFNRSYLFHPPIHPYLSTKSHAIKNPIIYLRHHLHYIQPRTQDCFSIT